MTEPRIIIALDFSAAKEALAFVSQIDPKLCRLKIGLELFCKEGPIIVEKIRSLGFSVFLDLKLHDIPNTVAATIHSLITLDPWMLSIHALGGVAMMKAALEAAKQAANPPIITAVTMLTSLDVNDAYSLFAMDVQHMAVRLARLAQEAGCKAMVTSAHEIPLLNEILTAKPVFVVPGIRLAGSNDDQRRIATPKEALAKGADFLVIGRPITRAKDPLVTLQRLDASIRS